MRYYRASGRILATARAVGDTQVGPSKMVSRRQALSRRAPTRYPGRRSEMVIRGRAVLAAVLRLASHSGDSGTSWRPLLEGKRASRAGGSEDGELRDLAEYRKDDGEASHGRDFQVVVSCSLEGKSPFFGYGRGGRQRPAPTLMPCSRNERSSMGGRLRSPAGRRGLASHCGDRSSISLKGARRESR